MDAIIINDYVKQADMYLTRALEAFETFLDRVLTPEEIMIFKCGASYGMRFTGQYIEDILSK